MNNAEQRPQNPTEILAALLQAAQYQAQCLDAMRKEQRAIMEQQLKAIKRITLAAEVFLLLALLGVGLACCSVLGLGNTFTSLR